MAQPAPPASPAPQEAQGDGLRRHSRCRPPCQRSGTEGFSGPSRSLAWGLPRPSSGHRAQGHQGHPQRGPRLWHRAVPRDPAACGHSDNVPKEIQAEK